MLKKGDKIMLLSIAVIVTAYFAYTTIARLNRDKTYAIIEVDGKTQEKIELIPGAKERIIEVRQRNGQLNILRVRDGKAKMIDANCPDKICVHTPETNTPNLNIVCIPNRVVILIKGENEDLDMIVR